MSIHETPIDEIVQRDDGMYVCPKCGEAFEEMGAWVAHVDDIHQPFREFVYRWSDFIGTRGDPVRIDE